MCVVPSGSTTSSSVRSPTTITRGVAVKKSFGWQFFVGERQVDPAGPVQEVGGGIPDGPDDRHTDHEDERQLPGYGKGGVHNRVKQELVKECPEDQHAADPGECHRRDAEEAPPTRRFPGRLQSV